jgi:hypothetical protein
VLDGGQYRGEITCNQPAHVAVTVTSPPDARTGIQFSRTVNLFAGATQVRLDCTMKNISRRPVRWSVWEVTQLDTADPDNPERPHPDFWAYCPLNPRSVHPKGFSVMFGQATHPSFRPDAENGLLAVKFDYRVGKAGLDSHAGWLAAVNGKTEHCFVGRFAHFPGAQYPDHASVEFWLNGAGEFIINGLAVTNMANPKETPYLMEAEILSPLADLPPEQEYEFRIDWFATRCPKPVVDVTPAGAVHRRLAVFRQDGSVLLAGVFGVFHRGRAEAVFKAADGKAVGQVDLGKVTPDQPLRISRSLTPPPSAYRVSVLVLDEEGENRGGLGNAVIPSR